MRPVIGVNIGKTKVVELEDAVSDYLVSARSLAPAADYLVVNVSSPNTPGLRLLQDVETLRPLLTAVGEEADKAAGRHVPLLVKIAPDLSDEDIDDVARLALDLKLDGIIATNTTIARTGLASTAGQGGDVRSRRSVRGAPEAAVPGGPDPAQVRPPAMPLTLVSVGGVETAQDVQDRLDAGATLVQGYTAFLYEGPFWAARINKQLAKHQPALTSRARSDPDRSLQARSPGGEPAGGFLLAESRNLGTSGGELSAADLGLGQPQFAELQGAHGAVPDGTALDLAELLARAACGACGRG